MADIMEDLLRLKAEGKIQDVRVCQLIELVEMKEQVEQAEVKLLRTQLCDAQHLIVIKDEEAKALLDKYNEELSQSKYLTRTLKEDLSAKEKKCDHTEKEIIRLKKGLQDRKSQDAAHIQNLEEVIAQKDHEIMKLNQIRATVMDVVRDKE